MYLGGGLVRGSTAREDICRRCWAWRVGEERGRGASACVVGSSPVPKLGSKRHSLALRLIHPPPALPQGFELVKAVYLESELFSVENELLTPTFKLKRPQLQKKYQAEIDAMYAALKKA